MTMGSPVCFMRKKSVFVFTLTPSPFVAEEVTRPKQNVLLSRLEKEGRHKPPSVSFTPLSQSFE
ncbi:hypothetical protein JCM14450A_04590 [Geobacillus stearothermophilus]